MEAETAALLALVFCGLRWWLSIFGLELGWTPTTPPRPPWWDQWTRGNCRTSQVFTSQTSDQSKLSIDFFPNFLWGEFIVILAFHCKKKKKAMRQINLDACGVSTSLERLQAATEVAC